MSPDSFHIAPAHAAGMAAAIAVDLFLPLAAALLVRRRLGAGWRYLAFGALVFYAFEVLSELLQNAVQKYVVIEPSQWATMLLLLTFAAALVTEIGRWVGLRLLVRREARTWSNAIMYGVGHVGPQCIYFGSRLFPWLLVLLAVSSRGLGVVPPEQQSNLQLTLAQISRVPAWLPLAESYELLCAMPVQIALALLVLQAFRRRQIGWVPLAVFARTAVDFTINFVRERGHGSRGSVLIVEILTTMFGLLAMSVIALLRDVPAAESAVPAP